MANYLSDNDIEFPDNAAGFTNDFWEVFFEIIKQIAPEVIPGLDTYTELKQSFDSYSGGDYTQSAESFAWAVVTIIPIDKAKDLFKLLKATRKSWKVFKMVKKLRGLSDEIVEGFKKTIFDSNKMSHIFDNVNHNLDSVVNFLGSRESVIAKVYEKLHSSPYFNQIPNSPVSLDIPFAGGFNGETIVVKVTKVNGIVRISTMWAL